MNAEQAMTLNGRVQVRYGSVYLTGTILGILGDESETYITVQVDGEAKARTFLGSYVEPEEPLLSLARAGREA